MNSIIISDDNSNDNNNKNNSTIESNDVSTSTNTSSCSFSGDTTTKEDDFIEHNLNNDTIFCKICEVIVVPYPASKQKKNQQKLSKNHIKTQKHKKMLKKSTPKQKRYDSNSDDSDNEKTQTLHSLLCKLCFLTNSIHNEEDLFCLPPPFFEEPQSIDIPFITNQNAAIPKIPSSLHHFLDLYGGGHPSRMPNIDIDHNTQEVKSLSKARKMLTEAHDSSRIYWGAFLVDGLIAHPKWWPSKDLKDVPGYNQMIVSRGNTDIGLHIDQYEANKEQKGKGIPVNTYLTICKGKKQVLMLPPDRAKEVFPEGVKTIGNFPFPLKAESELAQKIKQVGGFYFQLQLLKENEIVTLNIPNKWSHWLLGLEEWCVLFGGSLFP